MATNMKKTNAKATAKPVEKTTVKQNEEIVETVEEIIEETVEEIYVESVKEKKIFTDSDYVLCRSVCSGGLNIIAQSGNLYEFNDYGAECEINYRDLVTLIRRGSEHVFLPRFVILDDDFLEDFPTVKKVYGTMYTMNDLIEILEF